jgi:hypothetical protein
MRLMLDQLRATMRDVSFHGFDEVSYTCGMTLSVLEDGDLTWANQYQMTDSQLTLISHRAAQYPSRWSSC